MDGQPFRVSIEVEEGEVKLRVHRGSLRLRISPSDIVRFSDTGLLEETLSFGRDEGAELTYALVHDRNIDQIEVKGSPCRVAVHVPGQIVEKWLKPAEVGFSGTVDLGAKGTLDVLVEKDFACLDKNDEENEDTFPNPLAGEKIC